MRLTSTTLSRAAAVAAIVFCASFTVAERHASVSTDVFTVEFEAQLEQQHQHNLGMIKYLTRSVAGIIALCVGTLVYSLIRGKISVLRTVLPVVVLGITIVVKNTLVIPWVDFTFNRVQHAHPLPVVSERARVLHGSSFVADSHSDTLLWFGRNFMVRNTGGHVDIPRLIEGNIALQGMTIVTGTPPKMNFESNAAPSMLSDQITLKALFEGWGMESLQSRAARVSAQVRRLREAADSSNGVLRIIQSRTELDEYLALRSKGLRNITATWLGIEGLHALDDDLMNLDLFFDLGIRMAGPTHFFDNGLGGSAHGINKGGLTPFGKEVVGRMANRSIAVDIAHASEAVVDDILALEDRPPIISSHTGVRAICDSRRNLVDRHVEQVCKAGGLLSVAFFRPAICGPNEFETIVATMKHIRKIGGIECIALGSDWDGFVVTPFDASQIAVVTESLLADGSFSDDEIRAVLGGNTIRFLRSSLPA